MPGSNRCTGFIVVLIILGGAFFFFPGPKAHADGISLRRLVWDGYVSTTTRERFSAAIKSKYNIDLDFEITDASDPDDFFDTLRMEKADIISPAHNLAKDSRYNLTTNGLTLPIDQSAVPKKGTTWWIDTIMISHTLKLLWDEALAKTGKGNRCHSTET